MCVGQAFDQDAVYQILLGGVSGRLKSGLGLPAPPPCTCRAIDRDDGGERHAFAGPVHHEFDGRTPPVAEEWNPIMRCQSNASQRPGAPKRATYSAEATVTSGKTATRRAIKSLSFGSPARSTQSKPSWTRSTRRSPRSETVAVRIVGKEFGQSGHESSRQRPERRRAAGRARARREQRLSLFASATQCSAVVRLAVGRHAHVRVVRCSRRVPSCASSCLTASVAVEPAMRDLPRRG